MSTRDAENPSPTSYEEILELQIEEGLDQLNRPFKGLALSGLSAGLDIGFGPFLMAVVLTLTGGAFSDPLTSILVANAYAVGFLFVVVGRSELFTEHTTLAVVPVLDGDASVGELARLWGTVWVTNIVGGIAFAALAVYIGPRLGSVDPSAFTTLAHHMVSHSTWVLFVSAVLAGWLMGLMTWLVAAGQNTVSQAGFVWIIAFVIGISNLPHSIAGSVEVLVGVFVGGVNVSQFLVFLAASTLGNVLGGSVFVGLLKYGYSTEGEGAEVGSEETGESSERTDDSADGDGERGN